MEKLNKVFRTAQLAAIDKYTIEHEPVSSLDLMERAAGIWTDRFLKIFTEVAGVVVIAGNGNNGGDGYAIARLLNRRGVPVRVFRIAGTQDRSPDCEANYRRWLTRGKVEELKQADDLVLQKGEIVIDAIFGSGLNRPVTGLAARIIKQMNASVNRVVAVDIPSGIHSGTGAVMGIALKADETVAFGWEKIGTAVYPGRDYAGNVTVADIGFPEEALRVEPEEEDPISMAYACEESDLNRVPERKAYSNKGTFGRVLIAAGSKNMSGAAYLSALGAYRAGAGLVKILTVEENRTVLQTLLPEAIISSYRPEELLGGREDFKERIEAEMNWADVVVLGPGLGSEPYVEYLVEDILTSAFVPVIIDADGLNTIASHPYLTSYYTENIVITPHLGEMARLTSQKISEIQADLPAAAFSYASHYGITCVLKDAAAVTAGKEGTLYINTSGSSAMAKAGSGDVLTGILAGLMALGMEEEEAAALGVYIHGLAGERAAGNKLHSLLASEIAEAAGAFMDRQKEEIKTK